MFATGFSQLLSEGVATFGLITVVRLSASPSAIAGYIVGAYWFTSSTSFANPAVTLARTLTDTFSLASALQTLRDSLGARAGRWDV